MIPSISVHPDFSSTSMYMQTVTSTTDAITSEAPIAVGSISTTLVGLISYTNQSLSYNE